jgi:hypothetical protein
MESDTTLLLDLDERNLAHYLTALALAALGQRIEGKAPESRRCWWPDDRPGQFAIQTEHPPEVFLRLLFENAHRFIAALEWNSGLDGVEQGIITSGEEMGVNPFVSLDGEGVERPLLRAFSAKVVPQNVLPRQKLELKSPSECLAWLNQRASGAARRVKDGVSSWGYDCRVNLHASDAGISSDAEGTGSMDPIYPAIELLSLAGAAFFAPANAWRVNDSLCVAAWTKPMPLTLTALASSGRIHGLSSRNLSFQPRGSAHGKGGSFKFFPPATSQPSSP